MIKRRVLPKDLNDVNSDANYYRSLYKKKWQGIAIDKYIDEQIRHLSHPEISSADILDLKIILETDNFLTCLFQG